VIGTTYDLKSISLFCRSLSTLLESGVSLRRSIDIVAGKIRSPSLKASLETMRQAVNEGDELTVAMKKEKKRFPQLTIDMISVGEQTGELPEILKGLADHYDNLIRMRRNFITAIAWPAFQLFAAIMIIALVIYIFGWIADQGKGEMVDLLGLGLKGTSGAITWLTMTLGTIGGLFIAYQFVQRTFAAKRFLDEFLIKIPVLGTCMQSFAIARFSWAFHLTQQTGMPMEQSLTASMKATGNGAFLDATDLVCRAVREGETVTQALTATGLFTREFMEIVAVAEESGTVPEQLHRLSPRFEEQARRSLTALATVFGWLIWACVAMFIIFFIFRIVLNYIGLIESYT